MDPGRNSDQGQYRNSDSVRSRKKSWHDHDGADDFALDEACDHPNEVASNGVQGFSNIHGNGRRVGNSGPKDESNAERGLAAQRLLTAAVAKGHDAPNTLACFLGNGRGAPGDANRALGNSLTCLGSTLDNALPDRRGALNYAFRGASYWPLRLGWQHRCSYKECRQK